MAEINIAHWSFNERQVFYNLSKDMFVLGILTRLYGDGTADLVLITERFTGGTWDQHERPFGTESECWHFAKEPADFRKLLGWDQPKQVAREEKQTPQEVFADDLREPIPVRKSAVKATRLR